MMSVAIVIVAYNRPCALNRLLGSIERAFYPGFEDIPLIISVDGGGDPDVARIAQDFPWSFGEKTVYLHKMNLGLRAHVLEAGDRTSGYDGIIMLEDDLVVSPVFYRYAFKALEAYQDKDVIGGVSLYSYRYLDINRLHFSPLIGNGNTFLVKFPSSSGQAWTTPQWQEFRRWLGSKLESDRAEMDSQLPVTVSSWPASSWKKDFARYLVDSGRYVVYPDVSLTTNMGDAGHHWPYSTLVFQVPIQFGRINYRFTDPLRAVSYDQFFELESRSLEALEYPGDLPPDLEFDLYGQKPDKMISDKLTVSSKKPTAGLPSYGMELLPHELNVLYGIRGSRFHLGPGSEFDFDSPVSRIELIRHQTEFLGGRDLVRLLCRKLLMRVRRLL